MRLFARVTKADGTQYELFHGCVNYVKIMGQGWRKLYHRMPRLDPGRLPR